jgi:uncharacterized protein
MTRGYRLLIKTARTMHIYLTLAGLLLILFFAFTGFILNHDDWFQLSEPTRHVSTSQVPARLLGELDKLAVVEYLRNHCGATGAVDAFDVEEDSCKIIFKSPGRQIEAAVKRPLGETEVVVESRGILGRLTDLHRGKESGPAWSLVIDGTSFLLLVISLTGLVLWYSLRTRFYLGLAALTAGAVIFATFYFLGVP